MKKHLHWPATFGSLAVLTVLGLSSAPVTLAAALPGGTIDPTSIPKYVTPLIIPPVMPQSTTSPAPAAQYDIAVRQFKQQILPGGIFGTTFPDPLVGGVATITGFPASTVWSYGRAEDPLPDSSALSGGAVGVAPALNSTFNFPAFTMEETTNNTTTVRWINDLVDPNTGNYLPHLFPIDQTLHWANPTGTGCVGMPMTPTGTDCHTVNPLPYTGPVPLVTHVHGAHVQPHSDGYPEAWWLPGAPGTKGIPANYRQFGSSFTQANSANTVAGSAYFSYPNTQPAATIWYHDHALGMTRTNVVAGPAGFWLIRGGVNDTAAGVLPGPAPTLGQDPNLTQATRDTIREIPIVIQDRAFDWADAAGNVLTPLTPGAVPAGATQAKLFYPDSRSFFDGFTGPYIGTGPSDIAPIWNPEIFFNTIVVNGTTWPQLTVAPARYRFRLLDGCTARTLNLSMYLITDAGVDGIWGTADDTVSATELPFYQIGGDQGFLPKVVKITKGFTVTYPGNGSTPAAVAAPSADQALLMAPAERADVIVDFGGLPNGTHVRMFNTGPDAPFQGFPTAPSDPLTTGQVMEFIVNTALPAQPTDTSSALPQNLVLPAEAALGASLPTPRKLSLNEMDSEQVCIEADPLTGTIIGTLFSTTAGDPDFAVNCALASVTPGNIPIPMGPRMALLGTISANGLVAIPKMWSDPLTELPLLDSTETWEIFNTTMDAHPIHLHLVRFQVVDRQVLIPGTLVPDPTNGMTTLPLPNEAGFKDTVVAYPGQVTRIKATFTIPGKYVWHCHIVDHEDNEMMRAYRVVAPDKIGVFSGGGWYLDLNGNNAWDGTPTDRNDVFGYTGVIPVSGDFSGMGTTQIAVYDSASATWYLDFNGNGTWDGSPADKSYLFGFPGAVPVTGNWSGLGFTKIGVYDPATFTWYLDADADGAWNPMMDNQYTFGATGVIPVTGDWNGDGKTKIGYYDPATFTWHLDYDGDGVWNPTNDKLFTFGYPGVAPVTGDWNGEGKTKIGVYDAANAIWYMDTNGNGTWDGTPTDANANFGFAGSTPVTGNW